MEKEFIMIKPDAVQRGFIGDIIRRIEKSGLKMLAMKFLTVTQAQAEKHYEVHKERPFYPGLVRFITSGPTVAIIVEGKSAVAKTRMLVGATNPTEATPGTIRGDFALDIGRNMVHASDSVENALTEIGIYFSSDEFQDWTPVTDNWLYE